MSKNSSIDGLKSLNGLGETDAPEELVDESIVESGSDTEMEDDISAITLTTGVFETSSLPPPNFALRAPIEEIKPGTFMDPIVFKMKKVKSGPKATIDCLIEELTIKRLRDIPQQAIFDHFWQEHLQEESGIQPRGKRVWEAVKIDKYLVALAAKKQLLTEETEKKAAISEVNELVAEFTKRYSMLNNTDRRLEFCHYIDSVNLLQLEAAVSATDAEIADTERSLEILKDCRNICLFGKKLMLKRQYAPSVDIMFKMVHEMFAMRSERPRKSKKNARKITNNNDDSDHDTDAR